MLKITGSIGSATNPEETEGEVGGNSVVSDLVGGGEATNLIKGKNWAKTTKSKIMITSKNHDFPKSRTKKAGPGFFTPKIRLAFTLLKQVFIEAPILHYFDPESYIQIEIDVSGYAIGGLLN